MNPFQCNLNFTADKNFFLENSNHPAYKEHAESDKPTVQLNTPKVKTTTT